MIVIQARDLINGTCGAPILAPNEVIARRQIGRMINENPILKDHSDLVKLDILGDWDPQLGLFPNRADRRPIFSGSQCLDEYLHALDAVNSPGEGELISQDEDDEDGEDE